jgi:Ca2+-binding EF-hand superfamily protein
MASRKDLDSSTLISKFEAAENVASNLRQDAERRYDDFRKRKPRRGFFANLCGSISRADINLNPTTKEMLDGIMLRDSELKKLYRVFARVDLDGSHQMELEEFFEVFESKRTPFTDALFLVVEDQQSKIEMISQEEREDYELTFGAPALRVKGFLTFDDFVQVLVTYCLFTKIDILLFAFSAFDNDGNGR